MVAAADQRHMLDTNVCVQILRGKTSVRALPPVESCFLSAIVSAELWTGLAKAPRDAQREAKFREFLSLFEVLSFDEPAAREYGDIRSALEKDGTPIGPLDTLIAAHARQLGMAVITANAVEFRRVKGLNVVEWK